MTTYAQVQHVNEQIEAAKAELHVMRYVESRRYEEQRLMEKHIETLQAAKVKMLDRIEQQAFA